MLRISWYIFVILILSVTVVWIIENNGTILINWIGFELETDILSAIIILVFFIVIMVFSLIVLTKLLSFKFPKLYKLFFKKSYTKKLEKIIKNHHKSFDKVADIMIAIEANQIDDAKKIFNDLQKYLKYKSLNDFFIGKFALESNDLKSVKKTFSEYSENTNAKILILKTEFKEAIKNDYNQDAIDVAIKILEIKSNEIEIAKELILLYLKNNKYTEIRALIKKFGYKNISKKFATRDLILINIVLSDESFRKKQYFSSFKYCRRVLKIDQNFLPAKILFIKILIKIGLTKIAILNLKKYWNQSPNMLFVEYFYFINRKAKINIKLKKIRKFIFSINNVELANNIFARFAFKFNELSLAKDSIIKANYLANPVNSYFLMSLIEKKFGNIDDAKKFFDIAKNINNNANFKCKKCASKSFKWRINCFDCNAFDSYKY